MKTRNDIRMLNLEKASATGLISTSDYKMWKKVYSENPMTDNLRKRKIKKEKEPRQRSKQQ
jgi:hypothetical protein